MLLPLLLLLLTTCCVASTLQHVRAPAEQPGLLGGFSTSDRTRMFNAPACFCRWADAGLPVLPGNLLFTETTSRVSPALEHQEQQLLVCSASHTSNIQLS